jgi:hypothetical protein
MLEYHRVKVRGVDNSDDVLGKEEFSEKLEQLTVALAETSILSAGGIRVYLEVNLMGHDQQ